MTVLSNWFLNTPRVWPAAKVVVQFMEVCGLNLRPPLEITRYHVASEKVPSHYKPLRIVLTADWHVGCEALGLDDMEPLVDEINALEPDLSLLAGDFQNSVSGLDGVFVNPRKIAPQLGRISAKLGNYATLGNHDIYEKPQAMASSLQKAGISYMYNGSVIIDNDGDLYNLVTVGDSTTGNANARQAFSETNPDLPTIVMTHNPMAIHHMPGGHDLVVAGHTHGGQVTIPGMATHILECPDSRLIYGQVRVNNSTVVTSAGLGTSVIPYRTKPKEITVITLGPAPER